MVPVSSAYSWRTRGGGVALWKRYQGMAGAGACDMIKCQHSLQPPACFSQRAADGSTIARWRSSACWRACDMRAIRYSLFISACALYLLGRRAHSVAASFPQQRLYYPAASSWEVGPSCNQCLLHSLVEKWKEKWSSGGCRRRGVYLQLMKNA